MLTDEQIIEMAPRILATLQTPGWQDYLRIIQDKIEITVDNGFNGEPKDLTYYQGNVDGLKAAAISGDDALNLTRQLTGEKREARRRSAASGAPSSSFD